MLRNTFERIPVTVSYHCELAKQIDEPCVGRCTTVSLLRLSFAEFHGCQTQGQAAMQLLHRSRCSVPQYRAVGDQPHLGPSLLTAGAALSGCLR
jgi:hypothetical protein